MNPKEAQEIIERLADKTLKVGCYEPCCRMRMSKPKEVILPVKLNDVLSKLQEKYGETHMFFDNRMPLVQKWQPLGFSKSLQEILSEAETEECGICTCKYRKDYETCPKDEPAHLAHCRIDVEKGVRFKRPQVSDLFLFIKELNLT